MKGTSRKNKGKKSADRDGERIPRPFGGLNKLQRQRGSPNGLYIALTADAQYAASTGAVFSLSVASPAVLSSATEWADFAAVWGEYRVISLTVFWQPYATYVSLADVQSATLVGYPGPLNSAAYGATATSGYAANIDNQGIRYHGAGERIVARAVGQQLNPFALEWCATTGTIPAAQSFGLNIGGTIVATATWNAVAVGVYSIYWDVEFRGRR